MFLCSNSLYFILNRVCKQIAATVNPTTNPIQIPTAPISNGKANTNPTDRQMIIYDTMAINIGTLTSVIPRNIEAATTCSPSANCNIPDKTTN